MTMARKAVTISVPEDMHMYVEARVRSGGYGSVSDFFRDLLRKDSLEQVNFIKNEVRPAPVTERIFRPLASASRRQR